MKDNLDKDKKYIIENFIDKMEDNNFEQIIELINNLFNITHDSIIHKESIYQWNNVKSFNNLIERFFTQNHVYEDNKLKKIYYFACVKTLVSVIELDKDILLEEEEFRKLLKIKDVKNIISKLGEETVCTDKELSEYLDESIEYVRKVMNNTKLSKVFSICESEEEQIYFINSKGMRFYKFIREKFDDFYTDEQLLLTFLKYIKEQISDNKYTYEDFMSKIRNDNLIKEKVAYSKRVENDIKEIIKSTNVNKDNIITRENGIFKKYDYNDNMVNYSFYDRCHDDETEFKVLDINELDNIYENKSGQFIKYKKVSREDK